MPSFSCFLYISCVHDSPMLSLGGGKVNMQCNHSRSLWCRTTPQTTSCMQFLDDSLLHRYAIILIDCYYIHIIILLATQLLRSQWNALQYTVMNIINMMLFCFDSPPVLQMALHVLNKEQKNSARLGTFKKKIYSDPHFDC